MPAFQVIYKIELYVLSFLFDSKKIYLVPSVYKKYDIGLLNSVFHEDDYNHR
ncbi:hypothetical protein NTGHW29_490024 [Candidatus Nitrotoga sp. HW29]|nr:hypothetical protein NTGHW29_490024 [Candidatus Nitrotoga sp. HW29]